MATYTASAPQYDSDGTPQHSPSSRSGFGVGGVAKTMEHTLSNTYGGGGFVNTVTGINPEGAALGTWNPQQRIGRGLEGVAKTADHTLSNTYGGGGFVNTVTGVDPNGEVGAASVIPTSYFRKATGKALDQNGEPIPNGLYVLALDNFSTVGPVGENGEFDIYLLRQDYENFILVGDAPDPKAEYDLVWYELAENPDLPVGADYVELRFDVEQPQLGAPSEWPDLDVGGDLSFL